MRADGSNAAVSDSPGEQNVHQSPRPDPLTGIDGPTLEEPDYNEPANGIDDEPEEEPEDEVPEEDPDDESLVEDEP